MSVVVGNEEKKYVFSKIQNFHFFKLGIGICDVIFIMAATFTKLTTSLFWLLFFVHGMESVDSSIGE